MLRRSLHIAVVTLILFASSAAAFPAEPSKPAAERTVLAALWQKVVAWLEVDSRPTTPVTGAQPKAEVPTTDDQVDQPVINLATLVVIPSG